jgi:hypothetical protein
LLPKEARSQVNRRLNVNCERLKTALGEFPPISAAPSL